MSTTMIDLFDALRTHLNDFELPPPCSVHLTTYSGRPQVSLQLATHHLPEIACGLLAWAGTLTETTAEAWRVIRGDSLHLSVTGQLSEGIRVQVYGSLPFTEHGIGADLAPNDSKTMLWALLRERTASTDPDIPPRPLLLLHAIAERQRWKAEYTAAQLTTTDPPPNQNCSATNDQAA